MGCGSSVADKAIGLDGHDNVKKYVIQKNKQIFAEHYIKEIYKNTSGNIKRLRFKKLNQIDEHSNQAKKQIDHLKAQLDKKDPGSIKKAQDIHKKSAEDLLGLTETLKRLQSQKSIVNSRYEEQEKEILRQIREDYEKIYDGFDVSTAKLLHINSLPQNDRLRAFKWADQYAEKDIVANNKVLKEEMDKKFDFSNFEHRFDAIVPSKNLQDIVEDGREKALRTSVRGSKCISC